MGKKKRVGEKTKCISMTWRLTSQRQEVQGKDVPENDRKKSKAGGSVE